MKLHFWPAGLLCAWLATDSAIEQRRPPRQADQRPAYLAQLASFEQSAPITRVKLKNGLRVLLHETHSWPVVSIMTVMEYGRADEPAGQEGLSILLQRLLLNQMESGPFGDLSREIQTLGGRLHTSVAHDRTIYEIAAPAAQWKKAIELHSRLLTKLEWAEEEFVRQRDDLLGDAGQIAAEAAGFHDELMELAYPGIRLAPGGGGWVQALQGMTLQDFNSHVQALHGPNRAMLIVSGDIITSDVLTEMVRFYGRGPRSPQKPRLPSKAAPDSGFAYFQKRTRDALPRILVGFRTPSCSSPDFAAVQVLKAILAEGEGSIVKRRLRDEKGAVLDAEAELGGIENLGLLSVQMTVHPADIDRAEITFFTEIEILKRQDPDNEELARAVAQLEMLYWYGLQTVSERAAVLADHEFRNDWKGMSSYLDRLRRVKAADITRVARRYLNLDDCILIEHLPAQHEERALTREAVRELIMGLLKPATEQEMAAREKVTRPEYQLPRRTAAFKLSELNYPMKRASILRGPELFIREDHTQPLIYMGLYYPGGRLFEEGKNAGITSLLLATLLRDTTETSSERLYRQLEIYGGRIMPIVKEDYFGVSFLVSSASVEPALDLLIEMFKFPKLEDDEVKRQKEILLARISREQADADVALHSGIRRNLFQGHPYALPGYGHEAGLAGLTPQDVRNWYESTIYLRKPMVVIIGDTRGTSLAEYFVRNFSGSRYQDTKLAENFPKALEKPASDVVEWSGQPSHVAIAFQVPPWGDEDSPVLEVLRHYMAGAAPGIAAALRARQAPIRLLRVDGAAWLRGGWFGLRAATAAGSAEGAVKGLQDQIGHLMASTMAYRDFRAAGSAAIGEYQIRQQNRLAEVNGLVEGILAGRPLKESQSWVDALQDVRQEDLPEAARRYLDVQKAVTLILRARAGP